MIRTSRSVAGRHLARLRLTLANLGPSLPDQSNHEVLRQTVAVESMRRLRGLESMR